MALKPCLECGTLSATSRCPRHDLRHRNAHWSRTRSRQAQHRFRQAVLNQAGNQCQHINAQGIRCPMTTDLQAHHTIPGNDHPATGAALCRAHHRAVDPKAR